MLFIASWVTRENIAPPYITISELPVGSIVSAYLQTALFSLLVMAIVFAPERLAFLIASTVSSDVPDREIHTAASF